MGESNTTQIVHPLNGSPRLTSATPLEYEKKYKSLAYIMANTSIVTLKNTDSYYSDTACDKCGLADKPEEMLLCDKCDKGFHMDCVRPGVVRIPVGSWFCPTCTDAPTIRHLSQTMIIDFFKIEKSEIVVFKDESSLQDCKRRRRTTVVLCKKKRRRLLSYIPTRDPTRRLHQMRTLATALTALNIEFSNELTYSPGMAPRSANRAQFEHNGVQVGVGPNPIFIPVLSREDHDTLEQCRFMAKRGEYPPVLITYDEFQGYTIEADGLIKDMALLAEYTGDVDYMINRESDDSDSLMTLILSTDPSKCLVICADKRANISRFVSGINNHIPGSKKKENVKCVRYDVNGECCVLLVATRDIAKGERLYYDYNGYENAYPTHHFV